MRRSWSTDSPQSANSAATSFNAISRRSSGWRPWPADWERRLRASCRQRIFGFKATFARSRRAASTGPSSATKSATMALLPRAFRSGVAYGRGACSAVRHERNCEPQGRSGQNPGSGRRGDLPAPTTEFLLKPRPPQPQRVADHADGGRDMAAAAMIGDKKRNTG